jgi:hypothetical protein
MRTLDTFLSQRHCPSIPRPFITQGIIFWVLLCSPPAAFPSQVACAIFERVKGDFKKKILSLNG